MFFLLFIHRSVPFVLGINEEITCVIDDGSGKSCQNFVNEVDSIYECKADIAFTFSFTNRGFACVYISDIRVALGPFGDELLCYDDIYEYNFRWLCPGETWTVPDRRKKVNLCKESDNEWDISIEVKESRGQQNRRRYSFPWSPYTNLAVPFPAPTASPTVDTCDDCTLTGLVSASKYSITFFMIDFLQYFNIVVLTYCSFE